MLLIVEIGLLIWGIKTLISGEMKFGANKVVYGTPARLLGVAAILPLPMALGIGFIYGMILAAKNPGADPQAMIRDQLLVITLIEAGIVFGMAILIFGIGMMIGEPPYDERRSRRRRRREDEYDDRVDADDFDDRPSRRRRDEEYDDEYDDRPRRRRQEDDYDDQDERPRRRRDDY